VATRIATHTQVLDDGNAFLVEPTAEAMAAGLRRALSATDEVHARADAGHALVSREYSVTRYRDKIAAAYAAVERLAAKR
jgi:glycosyltransferase involved in cell wall biosynthesis